MMLDVILAPVLAFLLTVFSLPLARRAALHLQLVDRPDGRLKVHPEPVPYLGGLAIFLAYLVTLAVVLEPDQRVLALLIGGTLMVLLGLIDDFGTLPPSIKFAGQVLTVFVLVRSNIMVEIFPIPPVYNLLITSVWIVGICNAFNIIDIMDGLAAGSALVAALVLGIITFLNGQWTECVLAGALVGVCLGFLVFNWHPASIYLGDAGSLFLGMTLGVLAMMGDYSRTNSWAVLNPLLIFSIPIFDTAYVMVMRAWHGRPIFRGSKDHFAVRLRIAGYPVRHIVGFAVALQALLGGAAIYNMYASPRFAWGLYSLVLLAFVAIGVWLARIPIPRESSSVHAASSDPS